MQQTQQREQGDRISWARAIIFGVGFFFIAALLVGQIPSYIYYQMTSSSLTAIEYGNLALGLVCLAGFIVIQVVVLLFDPKPVIPPMVFSVLGLGLTVGGLALLFWAAFTNNQYFPTASTHIAPVLGGNFIWFEPGDIDFVMLGLTIAGIGIAMIFYSVLALREQRNPDRSDPGTTPAIRAMLWVGLTMLFGFMIFYTFVSDQQLGSMIGSYTVARTIINTFLGIAVLCTLGAFALRLHYLMRPVRKRTMSVLYIIGINLAQFGVLFLLVWLLMYPVINWMHYWSFIGLGDYLTLCPKKSAIPQSCAFSAQAGYIVAAVIDGGFFALLMGAIAAWKTRRNLVVIGSVTVTAVLSLATLLVHTAPAEVIIAALLCGGGLGLAAIWTSVARREFAIVGEKNLGCIGQWLVLGTCLTTYIAAFAFFSLPIFANETETNIPFIPGGGLVDGPPGSINAVVVFVIIGALAALQFYFLTRNRYKI
jgi:hypothetical protein